MPSTTRLLLALQDALRSRDLSRVRKAAVALPGAVPLPYALAILTLMAEVDDTHFERAGAVWLGRYATEVLTVDLTTVRTALDAIGDLPAQDAKLALQMLIRPQR